MPDQNQEPVKGKEDDSSLQYERELELKLKLASERQELKEQMAKLAVDYTEPILRYFEYQHLPEKLQQVSRPFHELAQHIVGTLPRCPERTVALRKLLEGKDAAVRAAL